MDDIRTSGPYGGGIEEAPGGAGARRGGASVRRRWPLLAGAAVLVLASSTGGAVAGGLITSSKIKDFTIQNRDIATNAITVRNIRAGSVQAQDLTQAARAALQGQPGAAGSVWLTGVGAPGNLAASDGDWYLDTSAQALYTRVGGAWGFVVTLAGMKGETGATGEQGPKGDTGAAGANGSNGTNGVDGAKGDKGEKGEAGTNGTNGTNGANGTNGVDGKAGSAWSSGTGAPSGAVGVVGDWYLDTAAADAYQKTDATTWTLRVNLRGIQGEKGEKGVAGTNGTNGTNGIDGDDGLDGATWLTGAGVPLGTLGKETDLYLDTATSDVYRKSSVAWALLTNIKGQKGDPGTNGTNGTNGAAGAAGTNGAAGSNGVDGATWLTGTGAPSDANGKNTDLYLNTTNGDVYKRGVASWGSPIANLTGPAGADGSGGGGGTSWSSGAGAPDPGTVNPTAGAFYLNTANGAIYKGDGTAWTLLYTPAAVVEQFPNVEVAAASTTSQTLPGYTPSNDGATAAATQPLAYGSSLGGASLSGGNSWDGTVFTVGATGAGWYTFTAQARASNISPYETAGANLNVLMVLTKNTASFPIPATVANGWLGQAVVSINSTASATARNMSAMTVTVRLAAGDKVRVLGWGSSTGSPVNTVTDGSTNITVTRVE